MMYSFTLFFKKPECIYDSSSGDELAVLDCFSCLFQLVKCKQNIDRKLPIISLIQRNPVGGNGLTQTIGFCTLKQ